MPSQKSFQLPPGTTCSRSFQFFTFLCDGSNFRSSFLLKECGVGIFHFWSEAFFSALQTATVSFITPPESVCAWCSKSVLLSVTCPSSIFHPASSFALSSEPLSSCRVFPISVTLSQSEPHTGFGLFSITRWYFILFHHERAGSRLSHSSTFSQWELVYRWISLISQWSQIQSD